MDMAQRRSHSLIEDYDYIWGFAVATSEEALQLRTFGVKKPILILGIVFEEYFAEMIAKEIRLTVCTYEMAQKLSEEAQRQRKRCTYPYRSLIPV